METLTMKLVCMICSINLMIMLVLTDNTILRWCCCHLITPTCRSVPCQLYQWISYIFSLNYFTLLFLLITINSILCYLFNHGLVKSLCFEEKLCLPQLWKHLTQDPYGWLLWHVLHPFLKCWMLPSISQIHQAYAHRIPSENTHSHLYAPLPLAAAIFISCTISHL